jgi:cellulose biosynthesis protein BcsQ
MAAPRQGRITTFYSYKGGTGRSMALANFAWLVASSGKRVVVIDWDLEAPGLHRYFRPFLSDRDLSETDGLIDAFWQFAASATMGPTGTATPALVQDQREYIAEALQDSTRRLNYEFATKGYIDFICAGRQGPTYSERVNTFDWKRFYEMGGAQIVVAAREYLRSQYDCVLIDSRTGVSDTSGICTIQLPDQVVACFTLNRQSVEGVAAILRSIRDYRSPTTDGSRITFFPLATRIENGEAKRLEVARKFARDQMNKFIPSEAQTDPRTYWDRMEISYRPAYAFEEVLAAFGDASGATGAADSLLTQTEKMAQVVSGEASLRAPEVLEEDRQRVLEAYAFDGKLPEGVKPVAQTEDSAEAADQDFRRSVISKEQLWRASDFHWRLLLSRREVELVTDGDQLKFGRNVNMYIVQSKRAQSFLKYLDRMYYGSLLIAFVCSPTFIHLYYGGGPIPESVGYMVRYGMPIVVGLFAVLFVLSLLLSALFGNLRTDLPYGMSPFQTFRLMILGPFRGRIRDYDQVKKQLDPPGP